jgi:hypothetical protein
MSYLLISELRFNLSVVLIKDLSIAKHWTQTVKLLIIQSVEFLFLRRQFDSFLIHFIFYWWLKANLTFSQWIIFLSPLLLSYYYFRFLQYLFYYLIVFIVLIIYLHFFFITTRQIVVNLNVTLHALSHNIHYILIKLLLEVIVEVFFWGCH